MGGLVNAPINEAIFLLNSLAPTRLSQLKAEHPTLQEQLVVGVACGDADEGQETAGPLLHEKASVMIAVLEEAATRAHRGLHVTSVRIAQARRRRLVSQVLVLVGSSTLLGSVALDGKVVSVVSAVMTTLAALGTLLAEHRERLLTPSVGSVYDAFQRLGEGSFKARRISSELGLAIRYGEQPDAIVELIARGNALCEELNSWLIQAVEVFSESVEPDKAAPSIALTRGSH